jgi:hypothetical protein
MTEKKSSASMQEFSLFSEEVERTLRRLAWKDEDFREALLADPKGVVIHYLFHQSLPIGKFPN